MDGTLPPGTRLVESTLAEQLGVSRGPVREASRQLEREGLVEILPRRGAYVASVTLTQALDSFAIRIGLEGVAAELAAERRTDEDLDRMQAIIQAGVEALTAEAWSQLTDANKEFHQAIAQASANAELLRLRVHHDRRFTWLFYRSFYEPRGEEAWSEHQQLLDAIEAGDPVRSSEIATSHVRRSRDIFLATTTLK